MMVFMADLIAAVDVMAAAAAAGKSRCISYFWLVADERLCVRPFLDKCQVGRGTQKCGVYTGPFDMPWKMTEIDCSGLCWDWSCLRPWLRAYISNSFDRGNMFASSGIHNGGEAGGKGEPCLLSVACEHGSHRIEISVPMCHCVNDALVLRQSSNVDNTI